MASPEDRYLAMEIEQDFLRLLPNLHKNIAEYRARVAQGQDYGATMTADARSFLGRLRRFAEYAQEDPTAVDAALAELNLTRTQANNRVTSLRDALRIFRDAAKGNAAQTTAAINALEAAIPAKKRFLDRALPSDW